MARAWRQPLALG